MSVELQALRPDAIHQLAREDPETRNARLLKLAGEGAFDFIDIGTHRGGGIRFGRRLGGRSGLGVELNPLKAQRAFDAGYPVYTGDLASLPSERLEFRFAVCRHVLEHLPDRQSVRSALASLTRICSEFIYIEQPIFDYPPVLKERGLTLAHLTMDAHTCRLSVEEFLDVLEEAGVDRYVQARVRPIGDSSHPWVHRADAAPNRSNRDPATDPEPPPVRFKPPLYRDMVVVADLGGADPDAILSRHKQADVQRRVALGAARGRAARLPQGMPAFVIIGAQKAATRWLRLNLGKHPDVFTPSTEPSYFNTRRYERGPDWYRSRFAGAAAARLLGEATPGYMIWRHRPELVAERIDRDLPGVRLFALLRNPVERLYSAFIHHMRRDRIEPDDDIVDRVRRISPEKDSMQLVAGGWYARSLEPYLRRFGPRLQVILNEDVRSDPRAVYRRALEHIGVDPEFVPPDLEEVVFSRAAPRQSIYWERGSGRRALTAAERRALGEYFIEEIERLEELIGRDLSAWKAANDPDGAV